MAKVCPMEGCKAKEGMCVHDKMMVVIGIVAIAFVIYKFVL